MQLTRSTLRILSCSLVTAMLGACGDDGGGATSADEGDSSSTGGGGGAEETTAEAETTTPTTGEEPTTGEPFAPFPARGDIQIVRVEANPGVAVPIGLDGEAVGGAGRNAFIPGNRDMLIRAYVDVPEGWTPRPLEARLVLSGGGVDTTMTQVITVSEDSTDGDLKSTFYFGVQAKDVQPNVKYQVSLWESAPGQEALPEPAVPAVAPLAGPAFVGVESELAEMRVVLVPVDYKFGSCAALVDGEAHRKEYETALLQENPVERIDFTVHAPYPVDFDMTSYNGLSRLVGEMSQLRTDEGADANVYYYGLFDNCGGCIGAGDGIQSGCTVGLAADITGPDENDARFRAAAGQLNDGGAETFVHEIGHTQGRRHIECSGAGVQAQGTDPSYPYADGRIGVWGFGIRDFGLRHPTVNSDYMSYCGRTWVSDWQWNATYTRILKLSSWANSGAGAPKGDGGLKGGGVLIGSVDPDGAQMWWTGPGDLSSERGPSSTHRVIFEFTDGEVEASAQVSVRAHYATRNIVARLPEGFDGRELVNVRWVDEVGEHAVAPKTIRRLHTRDTWKAAH